MDGVQAILLWRSSLADVKTASEKLETKSFLNAREMKTLEGDERNAFNG